MERDLIFYQFSRSKVEQCDFTHFLSLYAPDKLPEGRALQEMMNCLVFCVEGWDNDPRETHTVPPSKISTGPGSVSWFTFWSAMPWSRCRK